VTGALPLFCSAARHPGRHCRRAGWDDLQESACGCVA